MNKKILIKTDGASNSMGAGIGFHFLDKDNNEVLAKSKHIGKKTNNEAEYMAVIEALIQAKKDNYTHVYVLTDSMLVVQQMKLKWKVQAKHLIPLFNKATKLAYHSFESFQIDWISRNQNTRADELSKLKIGDIEKDVESFTKQFFNDHDS